MTEPDTITRLNVSLPESMVAAIKDLARLNDRPVSREVRRALESHLNQSPDGKAARCSP